MYKQFIPGIRFTLLITVLTGFVYPGIVTALCQLLFKDQANGSLIVRDGKVIGSSLLGQNFTKPEYFQPRPSAAGSDGYDAGASSGSNLGPTSKKLADRVAASVAKFRKENPDRQGSLPADLLTASGSGLDPHLSPASASVQVERIARSRSVDPAKVQQLVSDTVESPDLGFLGEPRVNVLRLNLALDRMMPLKK